MESEDEGMADFFYEAETHAEYGTDGTDDEENNWGAENSEEEQEAEEAGWHTTEKRPESSDSDSDSIEEEDKTGLKIFYTHPMRAADDRNSRPRKIYEAQRTPTHLKEARKKVFDGVYPPKRPDLVKKSPPLLPKLDPKFRKMEKASEIPASKPTTAPQKKPETRATATSKEVPAPRHEAPARKKETMDDIPFQKPFDARKVRIVAPEDREDVEMADVMAKNKETPARRGPPGLKNIEAPALQRKPERKKEITPDPPKIASKPSILSRKVPDLSNLVDRCWELPLTTTLGQLCESSREIRSAMTERLKTKIQRAVMLARDRRIVTAHVPEYPWSDEDGVLIKISMEINGFPVVAIMDTGSQLDVIRKGIAEKVLQQPTDVTRSIQMNDANGGESTLLGRVDRVRLQCGGVRTMANLYVSGNQVPFDLLLGRRWQRQNFVGIDERKDGTYLIFKDARTLEPKFELLVQTETLTEAEARNLRSFFWSPKPRVPEWYNERLEERSSADLDASPEKQTQAYELGKEGDHAGSEMAERNLRIDMAEGVWESARFALAILVLFLQLVSCTCSLAVAAELAHAAQQWFRRTFSRPRGELECSQFKSNQALNTNLALRPDFRHSLLSFYNSRITLSFSPCLNPSTPPLSFVSINSGTFPSFFFNASMTSPTPSSPSDALSPTNLFNASSPMVPPDIALEPAPVQLPQMPVHRLTGRAPKIALVSNARDLMEQVIFILQLIYDSELNVLKPQFLCRETYGHQGPVDAPLTGIHPYEAAAFFAQDAANKTARGEELVSRPGAITSAQTYSLGHHTDPTGHEYLRLIFLNASISQHNPLTGHPHTLVGAVEVRVYAAPESQGTFWYIESPHPSRASLAFALKDYSISQLPASEFPVYATSVRPPLDAALLSHEGVDPAEGRAFINQFPIPRDTPNHPLPLYDNPPVFARPQELGIDIINSITEHNKAHNKRVYQFWRVGPNDVDFQKPAEWESLDWDYRGDRIFREFLPDGAPRQSSPSCPTTDSFSSPDEQVDFTAFFYPKANEDSRSNDFDLTHAAVMQIPDASDRFSRPESMALPPPPADESVGLQMARLGDHFARTVYNYRAGHNIPNAPVLPQPITPYTRPPAIPSFHVPTKPLAIVWDSDSDDGRCPETDCDCDCEYYSTSELDSASGSEGGDKGDDGNEPLYSSRPQSPPPPPPLSITTQPTTLTYTPPPIRRALLDVTWTTNDERVAKVTTSTSGARQSDTPSPLSLSPVGRATIAHDPTPLSPNTEWKFSPTPSTYGDQELQLLRVSSAHTTSPVFDEGTEVYDTVYLRRQPSLSISDAENTPRAPSSAGHSLVLSDLPPFQAPRSFINARISRIAEEEGFNDDSMSDRPDSLHNPPILDEEFGGLRYPAEVPHDKYESNSRHHLAISAPVPLYAAFNRLAAVLRETPTRLSSPTFKPTSLLRNSFPIDEDKEDAQTPGSHEATAVPEYLRHPQVLSVRVPDVAVNPAWLHGLDSPSVLFRTDDLIPPHSQPIQENDPVYDPWNPLQSPTTQALEWEYPIEKEQIEEAMAEFYDGESESSDYQGYRLLVRFDQEEFPPLMSHRPLRTALGLVVYNRELGDTVDYGEERLGKWPIALRKIAEIKGWGRDFPWHVYARSQTRLGHRLRFNTYDRIDDWDNGSPQPVHTTLPLITHQTPPSSPTQLSYVSRSTSPTMPPLAPLSPDHDKGLADCFMDSDSDSSNTSSYYSITRVDNAIQRRRPPLAPVGRIPFPPNYMVLSPEMARPRLRNPDSDCDEPAPKRQKIESSLQDLMQAEYTSGMLIADKWENDLDEMTWLRIDIKLMLFRYTAVIEALGLRDRFRAIYFPFPETFPIHEVYELFLADLTANHDGTFQRNSYHRNAILHDAEANFLQAAAILFRESRIWELALDCERILGLEFRDDAEVVKLFRAGFFSKTANHEENDPQSLGDRLREVDADYPPNAIGWLRDMAGTMSTVACSFQHFTGYAVWIAVPLHP
ncbi:hypothetical protein C8J57DRAFT_1656188 [Mycena rebaudengoi]|nr:hypothetical protein C8J57DRAFT_1656188 [Mycena rebaudengoi]